MTQYKKPNDFCKGVASEWAKQNPSFYEFAITLDQKHIGAVSVYLNESRQEGELGWIINPAYQGNGYATEAAKAVLDFAINTWNVKKIIAHCDCRNGSSCRVMRKIGLSLERDDGIRYCKGHDERVQEYMYSLEIH